MSLAQHTRPPYAGLDCSGFIYQVPLPLPCLPCGLLPVQDVISIETPHLASSTRPHGLVLGLMYNKFSRTLACFSAPADSRASNGWHTPHPTSSTIPEGPVDRIMYQQVSNASICPALQSPASRGYRSLNYETSASSFCSLQDASFCIYT